MSPWKPRPPDNIDESTRNHVLRVQSNNLWIGWTADGKLEYSEGYHPLPETVKLLRLLGPLIKQNVQRKQPKSKPRRSRWIKPIDDVGETDKEGAFEPLKKEHE